MCFVFFLSRNHLFSWNILNFLLYFVRFAVDKLVFLLNDSPISKYLKCLFLHSHLKWMKCLFRFWHFQLLVFCQFYDDMIALYWFFFSKFLNLHVKSYFTKSRKSDHHFAAYISLDPISGKKYNFEILRVILRKSSPN